MCQLLSKILRFNNNESAKEKSVKWLVVLLLLFFCILYAHNIIGWLIHDDEGGYLYQVWRMSEGEVPYRDFYSPKEPLFLFTGYLIFKFFGPGVFWVRMFTVIATILTGYLIFLIGRRIYDSKIGLLGLIMYLILPVVYFQARFYRPDAYEVFFSTLGLLLFIKAWQENKRLFFLYSGISYAISLGYKLGATLGIIALSAFILYQALIEKKIFLIRYALVPLIIGFLGAIIPLSIVLYSIAPSFLNCVIGHQAHQPLLASPHLLTVIIGNIKYFLMINPYHYGIYDTHSWLIIFSLPLITGYLFVKKDPKKIFTFYIFNICWLLFVPYPNEILRYLLYFLPVVVLVFTSLIFYLLNSRSQVLNKLCGLGILIFILVKVFIPSLIKDRALYQAKEDGTLVMAEYIKQHTTKEDYVVADYGDILFHTRRKTTPLMAGMSKSAVDNGTITSDKLIRELQGYRVKMILIHKEGGIAEDLGNYMGDPFGPHHFASLINSSDGIKFSAYLQSHYQFITNYNRSGQIFAVYVRK